MKLLDLIDSMADCEIVNVKMHKDLFIGSVSELRNNNLMKKYLDNVVINYYSLPSDNHDSFIVIFISNRKSVNPVVKKIKKEMLKNAIGLSDIGLMTYLNYLNILISMLYSFDLISKNEYDDLLNYLSKVDWYILCNKEV